MAVVPSDHARFAPGLEDNAYPPIVQSFQSTDRQWRAQHVPAQALQPVPVARREGHVRVDVVPAVRGAARWQREVLAAQPFHLANLLSPPRTHRDRTQQRRLLQYGLRVVVANERIFV